MGQRTEWSLHNIFIYVPYMTCKEQSGPYITYSYMGYKEQSGPYITYSYMDHKEQSMSLHNIFIYGTKNRVVLT